MDDILVSLSPCAGACPTPSSHHHVPAAPLAYDDAITLSPSQERSPSCTASASSPSSSEDVRRRRDVYYYGSYTRSGLGGSTVRDFSVDADLLEALCESKQPSPDRGTGVLCVEASPFPLCPSAARPSTASQVCPHRTMHDNETAALDEQAGTLQNNLANLEQLWDGLRRSVGRSASAERSPSFDRDLAVCMPAQEACRAVSEEGPVKDDAACFSLTSRHLLPVPASGKENAAPRNATPSQTAAHEKPSTHMGSSKHRASTPLAAPANTSYTPRVQRNMRGPAIRTVARCTLTSVLNQAPPKERMHDFSCPSCGVTEAVLFRHMPARAIRFCPFCGSKTLGATTNKQDKKEILCTDCVPTVTYIWARKLASRWLCSGAC